MNPIISGGVLLAPIIVTVVMVRRQASDSNTANVNAFLKSYSRSLSRLVVTYALYILSIVQMTIANRVLSGAEKEAITNIMTVFGRTIGAYELLAVMLILWAILPIVAFTGVQVFKYWKYGDEASLNEKSGEST